MFLDAPAHGWTGALLFCMAWLDWGTGFLDAPIQGSLLLGRGFRHRRKPSLSQFRNSACMVVGPVGTFRTIFFTGRGDYNFPPMSLSPSTAIRSCLIDWELYHSIPSPVRVFLKLNYPGVGTIHFCFLFMRPSWRRMIHPRDVVLLLT